MPHIDFKSYKAEIKKTPVTFDYQDKQTGEVVTYNMGTSLPVGVVLQVMELQKKGAENLSEEENIEMLKLLFGENIFND